LRWQRQSLASPFHGWLDAAAFAIDARKKIRHMLGRLGHSSVATCFALWRGACTEARQNRAVLARVERLLKRMLNRAVSITFLAWAENAAEQSRRRYSLQKLVTRWQRLQLASPFHDWLEWVEEVRENRLTLRKAIHRMTRVAIAGAFMRWKDNVLDGRAQAAALARAQRIMLRLRNRTVSGAFNAWRETASEVKRLRYSMRKLVLRWQRLQLAGPFHDWVDCMEEVRENRLMLRKAIHRMTRVAMAGSFAKWQDATTEARLHAAAIHRARRIVLRMQRRSLAAAFECFVDNCSEQCEIRGKMRSGLADIARHVIDPRHAI